MGREWGKRIIITSDLISIPIEPHNGTSYMDQSHDYPAGHEKPYYMQLREARYREGTAHFGTFEEAFKSLQEMHELMINDGWEVSNIEGQMWSYNKGFGLYTDHFDIYINKQLAEAFQAYRKVLSDDNR